MYQGRPGVGPDASIRAPVAEPRRLVHITPRRVRPAGVAFAASALCAAIFALRLARNAAHG